MFNDVPIIALTAPLCKSDIQETVKTLRMQGCYLISMHPDRPNLVYHVEEGDGPVPKIAKFLKEYVYST